MSDLGLELAALARRLALAGEGGLTRELSDGITKATRPAITSVRRGLPDYMPDPYAAVLNPDLVLSTIKSPLGPGLSIRGSTRIRRRSLRRLEAGILTHPLFGNRKYWYNQADGVRPHFFSYPLSQSAPEIRDAIAAVMADIADKITGKG